MSKYEIPFLTACIQAFGRRFSMTRQAAFRYLHKDFGKGFYLTPDRQTKKYSSQH